MQPPAIVGPIGPTMLRALRVLTRLALAALVLTLTFGGSTAVPAEASFPAPPQLRPAPAVGVPQPAARPVMAPLPPRPVDEHADAVAPPARPAGDPSAATTVPAAFSPPPADPGQGSVGRRAPPRA